MLPWGTGHHDPGRARSQDPIVRPFTGRQLRAGGVSVTPDTDRGELTAPRTARAGAGSGPAYGASQLLERDRELGVLDGLVLAALEGKSGLALVEGPAGIGKSRLLAAARQRADTAGFRVLAARGSDLEREFPFGVVRRLFDPVLVDPEQRARWLTGPAQRATRVFEPPDEGDATSGVSFGLLYGLFWLTANIAAEGPLLLVIDDLHWCDRSSLRFIAYLGRRLEGLRILVASAARIGEAGADSRLLGEIAHDPAAVSIRPSLLSEAAVVQLVRERLGATAAQAFCVACHRATGGNPLLLAELLKTLHAEAVRPDVAHVETIRQIGPRAVSRWVLLRLARLSADAVAVARAVAVLGDGAALPAIAALAELDESRVAEAVRTLAAGEILRSEPPISFVHPLVRDAVYHDLAPSERELQHERAARTLMELGAAPEALAVHLLLVPARAEPWVVERLRAAGLAAGRRGDTDNAASYLRRALEEPAPAEQRPRLLLELGLAEALLNLPAAAEHLREAREHLDDPLERGQGAELLVRTLLFTRPPHEAVAVARQAIAELPPEHVDQRRALEAFELWAPTFGASAAADSAARLDQARKGVQGDGPGARMLAAVAAWDWTLTGGAASECTQLALAALADGVLVAADPVFLSGVAIFVLALADHEQTLDMLEAMAAEAHRRGSPFALSGIYYLQGWNWLARGELAEAADCLRRSTEVAYPWSSTASGYTVACLAEVLTERGELAAAQDILAGRERQLPGSDADTLCREADAQLLVAQGRWPEALEAVDECAAGLRPGVVNPAWVPWRSLKALALEGVGDRDAALALLEQELAAARAWGAPRALSRTLRLLGTVRGGREGLDLLREAVQIAEESPARLEHAKALTALGSALRRDRQPAQAREPLRAGFEIASRCGAQPVVERARAELYAAGARPRREALTGPESLTPSERRVADLAADGQSNRDIAQALYVTPRTVEFHLTGVYRKLGIANRAEVAGALADPASG
jgi:DNA-binding CsgD family transcriptional regulator